MTPMTPNLRRLLPGLAILAIATLSGCVVEPEDNAFEDVGSFGWPTKLGTTMHYKTATKSFGKEELGSVTAEVLEGKGELENMYRLQTINDKGVVTGLGNQVHFLPSRDTLRIERSLAHEGAGFSARYALVAPLDRGRTWVASYHQDVSGVEIDSALMLATVVERYSFWKLEGKTYENVVAVKYTPTDQSGARHEWIRFYAKGVGVILTVHNVYPASSYPTQAPADELDRIVLTETTPAD